MAGEGGGARRGGEEKGEALPVWAPPLNPPPPSRALPRRCRAMESGEKDAQHHTRRLATACRDARGPTAPHFLGQGPLR